MTAEEQIVEGVRKALGEPPTEIERLRGGANNVVARVSVGGRSYAAKAYFTHPGDPRDRLRTEFDTLRFLWRHGVRAVPEPIGVAPSQRVAIYEFVEGRPVRAGDLGAAEVKQLVALIAAMWRLRHEADARTLPAASEAYFSVRAYLVAMEARFDRLRSSLTDDDVAAFVDDEVAACVFAVRRLVEAAEAAVDDELPLERRTLSPADFGFHNALRRSDGSLVFLDFEYAGWDDPAVVMAQACLAPSVPVPDGLREPLLSELFESFGGGPDLAARVRLLYPLVAFKWSMVALNDFLPVARERREFAGVQRERSDATQLEKSRRLLAVARSAAQEGISTIQDGNISAGSLPRVE